MGAKIEHIREVDFVWITVNVWFFPFSSYTLLPNAITVIFVPSGMWLDPYRNIDVILRLHVTRWLSSYYWQNEQTTSSDYGWLVRTLYLHVDRWTVSGRGYSFPAYRKVTTSDITYCREYAIYMICLSFLQANLLRAVSFASRKLMHEDRTTI